MAADRKPGLVVHQADPLNLETPGPELAAAPLTPAERFYVRNHGPVPGLDAGRWLLRVGGLADEPLELGLDDLRDGRFPVREVVATLQCAGNRRAGLVAVRDIPGEAPWGSGATGTASWRGVALADVLAAARPREEARHVAFVGADVAEEAAPAQPYGISVTRAKAEAGEVLLAWEMNGAPLPAMHGAPLRGIVPGYIGARSVKWLERIELRAEPWDGFFQETAYRLLKPDAEPGPGAGVPLGEIALNADVLIPTEGAEVTAGEVEVRGYAIAGGDRHVVRVEVSVDDGATWSEAELLEDLGRWAWRRWRGRVTLAPGSREIVARAWDSAAATQPESPSAVWNPKGYVNSSWGRVAVTAIA